VLLADTAGHTFSKAESARTEYGGGSKTFPNTLSKRSSVTASAQYFASLSYTGAKSDVFGNGPVSAHKKNAMATQIANIAKAWPERLSYGEQ